ncbi:pyroglutamyl peptidase [Virgibacillus ihumii]|uniref:pyroglutamyl peptidase n=1 Tax=Virgibacillus ihumii TaxID=2686091 RepID=UPI00157BE258|nr:pyroglutamyl peptidase [Virgibacillus ihumii]
MMYKRKRYLNFVLAIIVVIALSALVFSPSSVSAKSKVDCFDYSVQLTLEEQRITDSPYPYAEQILQHSGFDRFVKKFEQRLCSSPNLKHTQKMVKRLGTSLWNKAVARAQGKNVDGDLDSYDDRPLYWARLSMTKALRQWDPDFNVSNKNRQKLLKSLKYTSRGIASINFPKGKGVKLILVSGFDPYGFGTEYGARHSNPSGAIALQLDGLHFKTNDGQPAVIQSVNFPVLWKPFEEGIVENTFAPYLKEGPQQIDLMMTLSQGGPGKFDIEGYHGRWHVGTDNNGKWREGVIPTVSSWPMPNPLPEFIETTLPASAMINADTGPLPVRRDNHVCEWLPPNFSEMVCHDNGPTPGSKARSGGGGSYLSNEVGYRSNRVRLGLGAFEIPGGHVHIPSLDYPEDPEKYINPAFKYQRTIIVNQGVELVKAAAK